MMKYLVKHTPIKNGRKTYGVGEEFPYSDKDKSLLDKGYLIEVKDVSSVAKRSKAKTETVTERNRSKKQSIAERSRSKKNKE